MLDMAGTAQQDLHPARPIFLFDLEQCFKFAQVMRVAKRVLNALHGVVRLPVVMPHNAADTTQHVTAIDADAVVGRLVRTTSWPWSLHGRPRPGRKGWPATSERSLNG